MIPPSETTASAIGSPRSRPVGSGRPSPPSPRDTGGVPSGTGGAEREGRDGVGLGAGPADGGAEVAAGGSPVSVPTGSGDSEAGGGEEDRDGVGRALVRLGVGDVVVGVGEAEGARTTTVPRIPDDGVPWILQ
jgi:hypothetical protein